MKRGALTDTQLQTLQEHSDMMACVAVCVCIQDKYFFVPWGAWRDMKKYFNRLYVTAGDLEPWRVRFTGTAVLFMDLIHKNKAPAGLNFRGGFNY